MLQGPGGTSRRANIWVSEAAQTLDGPLVFYWHGAGGSPLEAPGVLGPAQAEVLAQGGIVVALTHAAPGSLPWYLSVGAEETDLVFADEAVACEPLGYVGYYSRGNVYDWPGLASRTVVAWSKSQPPARRCLENMARDLQPEYLFLRDLEVLGYFKDTSWLKAGYHVEKVFQIDPADAPKIPWLNLSVDTSFRIYKKNHPDDPLPYDDSLFPVRPG